MLSGKQRKDSRIKEKVRRAEVENRKQNEKKTFGSKSWEKTWSVKNVFDIFGVMKALEKYYATKVFFLRFWVEVQVSFGKWV